MRLARSVWVRLLRSRALRSLKPSVSFISTSASSAAVRPRKSAVEPMRQPARSRRLRLLRSISAFSSCDLVVLAQPFLTCCDDLLRGCLRRLAEHLNDHHRVRVDPVDNPPCAVLVGDAEFMTAEPYDRYWSRVGHR